MTVLDLRREARRVALPALDPGAFDPIDLEAARTNWRDRMVSEHVSARVFGALLGPMMRAGLAASEVRRVSLMAAQELDHAVLCAAVLAALGGRAVAELPPLDDIPRHEDVSPLEAVLRNVISIGCCSETVAVALVGTERELACPPIVRQVLGRILADEVKHARFGWRILARLAPTLEEGVRRSVDQYLVDVFEHQRVFHGGFLEMRESGLSGVAIGAPNGRSSHAVFEQTMRDVVIPGLEHHGFAARTAWDSAA